jgi:hypothetical protein
LPLTDRAQQEKELYTVQLALHKDYAQREQERQKAEEPLVAAQGSFYLPKRTQAVSKLMLE